MQSTTPFSQFLLGNPGKAPTNSAYPQDWIVGVDGTIVYVNTQYEPDEMAQIIEAELAK